MSVYIQLVKLTCELNDGRGVLLGTVLDESGSCDDNSTNPRRQRQDNGREWEAVGLEGRCSDLTGTAASNQSSWEGPVRSSSKQQEAACLSLFRAKENPGVRSDISSSGGGCRILSDGIGRITMVLH